MKSAYSAAFASALCATLLGLGQPAGATHYQLFILTGQSNSLGTTNGGEADPSSGSDPADAHVAFFWHNIVNASTTIGTSGGVFTTLQDQQGGVYAGSATHWGPEIDFARTLYRAGVRNFGIIKASRGGGGNSFWLKGSADDHMYDHVLATVNAATTELTNNGHSYEIVGLLYLQGESDNATEAAAAGTRLKTLTDNLRADLPNAASLRTVCAGITAQGDANDDATRSNQASIAASTSYIDYFENLDQQGNLAPDNLHLNKAGKTVVGNRFAQTFLNAGTVSRHYGQLTFIGDSITQGGNGMPSYRYQVFKHLAQAGVPVNAAAGYRFAGSVSGAYQNNAGSTADVNGQTFENKHDGHWGWRASWENARVALPAGRYNVNNLGQGSLENWTGQSTTFNTADQGTLTYTGDTYVPDSALIKIGINDLADGTAATQIRDDIATLIDQLRAANANVRIHLCQVLYSNNVAFSKVDELNALLPQLVADKNAASTTSPVWLIHTNQGFNPSTMTYDNTHPNAAGETHVGEIIAAELGITPRGTPTNNTPAPAEKKGTDLGCKLFQGNDIYNTGSYANNWTATGDITPTPEGTSDLRLHHPGAAGDVLDGSNTGWQDIRDGAWTLTTRLKFNDNPNGFILWLGTGSHRILIEIYADRTQDLGANSFSVAHNNTDGAFHTFKVTHDPAANVYHVWRDNILLTPAAGAPYDQTATDGRLLLGDYTGGSFGNGFDVSIDYLDICPGYEGNQIHDGAAFINNWTSVGGISASVVGGTDLQLTNTTAGGSWLEGTTTAWQDENDGYWTWEARIKFDANPNGFMIWLGTGSRRIWVEVYADRTQDSGANTFNVAHNNTDGAFHTFRIAHDPDEGVYHVWRDGVRLTPLAGAGYDSTATDERMILGDYTGGTFGNGFDLTMDYVRWEAGGILLPPGADADADGLPDVWENTYFGNFTSAVATNDDDLDGKTNAEEYQSDTNPNNASSYIRISTITSPAPNQFNISVPETSANRIYTLYESDDLGITDAWQATPGQGPFTGTGGEIVFTPTSSSNRYYRVEVSLP